MLWLLVALSSLGVGSYWGRKRVEKQDPLAPEEDLGGPALSWGSCQPGAEGAAGSGLVLGRWRGRPPPARSGPGLRPPRRSTHPPACRPGPFQWATPKNDAGGVVWDQEVARPRVRQCAAVEAPRERQGEAGRVGVGPRAREQGLV